MKTPRLIFFLFGLAGLPGFVLAALRTLTMSTPSAVVSGQAFNVSCSATTDQGGNGEQVAYFFAEYSLNGGSAWTAFCYDPTTGSTVNRTIPITAGAAGSTVVVRIMSAYRGGTAGDVDYTGEAMDWGGAWTNWQSPPAKYGYIAVSNPGASITADTIITNGPVAITNGMNVTYQAKRLIKLEPGFSVTGGGLFHAFLAGITSPGSVAVVSGTPFSYQIMGGNGTGTYTASNLPSGLSLNASTGLISGTLNTAGFYYVTVGNGTYSTTLVFSVSGNSTTDTDGDTLPDLFDPKPSQAGDPDTANTTIQLKVAKPQ